MTVFTVAFQAVAVSAAQDLFELVAAATSRIRILEVEVGQYSDTILGGTGPGEEIIPISFHRGHTVSGSGGTAPTPAGLNPYTRAAVTTAEVNNTTVATTSGTLIYASTWHTQAGFIWRPPEDMQRNPFRRQILVQPSTRFVVRIGAPADAITTNGTITFEEIGRAPVN